MCANEWKRRGSHNGVRQLSGMDILDLGSRDEFRMIFIGLIFVSKPIIATHACKFCAHFSSQPSEWVTLGWRRQYSGAAPDLLRGRNDKPPIHLSTHPRPLVLTYTYKLASICAPSISFICVGRISRSIDIGQLRTFSLGAHGAPSHPSPREKVGNFNICKTSDCCAHKRKLPRPSSCRCRPEKSFNLSRDRPRRRGKFRYFNLPCAPG